eukprot:FR740531.1.p1 GENE.FR740531.1~~FR740531.1.p1  ORF type:complete len:177 (-),score=27.06 FR740531.1:131-661(-)
MAMITPSAQLTLTKGNKSWSSTAGAAALELVDPLGSGPWLSLTAAAFFFFFFFFFSCGCVLPTVGTNQNWHVSTNWLVPARHPSPVRVSFGHGCNTNHQASPPSWPSLLAPCADHARPQQFPLTSVRALPLAMPRITSQLPRWGTPSGRESPAFTRITSHLGTGHGNDPRASGLPR